MIDADYLKEKKVYSQERHEYIIPVCEIDWMPTVEPKQGEWIDTGEAIGDDIEVKCSLCGEELYWLANFCPNCGADMRVKNELNRVSKELNSEIEKSKGKILPDYCDGLLYSMTTGDNFIGKEGDEK